MDSNSTIIIDLGKPLTPSVWNYTDEREFNSVGQTNSVYRVLADKFLPMVADVINDEGSHYKYGGKEYFKLDKIFERQQVGEHNNIISILGNRGTGKSSILRSIPYLFDHKSGRIHSSITEAERLKQFENCYFAPLQIIDPSAFKENDTLLEAFVSTLFTVFQTEIADGNKSSDNRKTDSEETRELIKAFKVTRQALQASRLESSKVLGDNINDTSYTDLQALEHLSSGTNLRKKLGYLVYSYIRWNFGNSKTNSSDNRFYLVLSVDDLDLFSGNVIQMLEDLRALIQIPGLLVTTALRYEQLLEEVESFYLKRFKELISKDNTQGSRLGESPNKMAQRYLIKLFPISKNIVAFDFKLGKNFKFIPAYPSNLKSQVEKDDHEAKNLPDFAKCKSAQDYFIMLFFSRTGILLEPKMYNNEHPLMPDSFRGYVQFVKYITALPQIYRFKYEMYKAKGEIDLPKLYNNLNQILEDWIPAFASANFSTPFRKFVIKVLNTPLETRNKFVVREILSLINKERFELDLKGRISGDNLRFTDEDLLQNLGEYSVGGIYKEQKQIKERIKPFKTTIQEKGLKDNLEQNLNLQTEIEQQEKDDDTFIPNYGFVYIGLNKNNKPIYFTKYISTTLIDIVKSVNISQNISFGDILLILSRITLEFSEDTEVIKVISILKLLYSIELGKNRFSIIENQPSINDSDLNHSIPITMRNLSNRNIAIPYSSELVNILGFYSINPFALDILGKQSPNEILIRNSSFSVLNKYNDESMINISSDNLPISYNQDVNINNLKAIIKKSSNLISQIAPSTIKNEVSQKFLLKDFLIDITNRNKSIAFWLSKIEGFASFDFRLRNNPQNYGENPIRVYSIFQVFHEHALINSKWHLKNSIDSEIKIGLSAVKSWIDKYGVFFYPIHSVEFFEYLINEFANDEDFLRKINSDILDEENTNNYLIETNLLYCSWVNSFDKLFYHLGDYDYLKGIFIKNPITLELVPYFIEPNNTDNITILKNTYYTDYYYNFAFSNSVTAFSAAKNKIESKKK